MPYGTLEVVLVDAKDLYDTASFLTKMDPYVIFTVKTQEKTSTVAQGEGTNPEWNENFLFTVTDDVTELRLKIMDKDTFTADDFVGEATIPLEPQLFTEGSIPPTSYNVVSKHQKYRGEITIGLNFTPDPESY
ncbi:16 kDa phloem protein 2 [Rosa sericea]